MFPEFVGASTSRSGIARNSIERPACCRQLEHDVVGNAGHDQVAFRRREHLPFLTTKTLLARLRQVAVPEQHDLSRAGLGRGLPQQAVPSRKPTLHRT